MPDYRDFFYDLAMLSDPGFTAVITTSANMHNPLVKRLHVKIHRQYEEIGSSMDMDDLNVNSENCGMVIRTNLIKAYFPTLDDDILLKLARNNRGFVEQDIVERVKAYLATNQLPEEFNEPGNTRDPFTGAWVERLVSYQDYKEAAELQLFKFELLQGFYSRNYKSGLKNLASSVLNLILKMKLPWSVNLSPFLAMKLIKK
jgi:hypothetical protein